MKKLYDALVKNMKTVDYMNMDDATRMIDYIISVSDGHHHSGGIYSERISFHFKEEGDMVQLHYIINMESFYKEVPTHAFKYFVTSLSKERDKFVTNKWALFKMKIRRLTTPECKCE